MNALPPLTNRHLSRRAETAARASAQAGRRLEETLKSCRNTLQASLGMREAGLSQVAFKAEALGALIDLSSLLVTQHDGRRHVLTPTEWRLLRVLAEMPGRTVGRKELALRLWGLADGRSSEVEVYVSRVRRKLGKHPRAMIETVRGRGYRLVRRERVSA
ncbi:MAG: helix-turn-helix domain-containing protein [Candidatus Dormibacteria bacterium]